jgi:hypothetical protein
MPMLLLFLLLIIFIETVTVKAEPVLSFFKAYSVSFDEDIGIFAAYGTGTWDLTEGFKNKCAHIQASPGNDLFLGTTLDVKSSFKTSFFIKIGGDVNLNFTRLRLKLADSTEHDIVLGRMNGRIAVCKGGRVSGGETLQHGKWYNMTISLDISRDSLTVSGNGSQLIQFSTGINIHRLIGVLLQMGVMKPSSSVEAFFDEFSMLVSPIVFTDKPVYVSSSSVQVEIKGDQFPTSSLQITIIRPDGSTLKGNIPSSSINSSISMGWLYYGFSYSTSLSSPLPGTYKIRVNSSGCRVEYHFGVWTAPKVWERKSLVNIKAGGFAPNSIVTISLRNNTREILSQRLNVDQHGSVNQNITVPVDLQTGDLKALLVYGGTYDFTRMSGKTDSIGITVVAAVLNVTVVTDADTYERVSPINIKVYIKYKDGTNIPWNSVVKMRLIYNGLDKQTLYLDYTHDSYWSKTIKLKPSDDYGDYLLRVEASDPYGNSGTGAKTVTITIAKLLISLVTQLEERYERSTKLNLSLTVKYKDETPVESGTVTLEITVGSKKMGPFSFTRTGLGQWSISQKIPSSGQTGRWDLKIAAVDDSGNMGDLFLNILVVPARLIVEPSGLTDHVFPRTGSIPVNVIVKYPSYEILPEESGMVNASLIHIEKGILSSRLLQFSAGNWRGDIHIPRDAPLGECVLSILAKDQYGNSGYYNATIEVAKAVLKITMEDLKDVYQAGFDTVYLKPVVNYLDGSTMDDGNVTAKLSSSIMIATMSLKYSDGKWVGEYGLPLTTPTGDYVVRIEAVDPYGNAGVYEDFFRVSNLYIILIVVSIAIAISILASTIFLRRRRLRAPPAPMAEDYEIIRLVRL